MIKIVNDEKQKITYDLQMIINYTLRIKDYKESRNELLRLLQQGYINYPELLKLRVMWRKKQKENLKLL